MSRVKHILGISGGKDSAALAIYMRQKYPSIDMQYYFCDTGKELDETYQLIENLKTFLGKDIIKLESQEAKDSGEDPFDFYYKAYRGYLPSSVARWCTKKMKLEPFERFVGDSSVVSYVGIRGDEDREGYISRKKNIQSIFPFRRNIWSEDIIKLALANENRSALKESYASVISGKKLDTITKVVQEELTFKVRRFDHNRRITQEKLGRLLDLNVIDFNHALFGFLVGRGYPLSEEEVYPLLDNDEILTRKDIFELLENSGVGIPAYYEKVQFELDGQKGEYARSRSGCYFCFFQQKIEWVWLYEQHPDLFKKAMKYENEKEGFTWNQNESLADLIDPSRIDQIKSEYLQKEANATRVKSPYLLDIVDDSEDQGCTACFI